MKRLLILTGPQGAGNHMWSKIFALHPQVVGWSALLNRYWIPHDQEPWAEYWRDPIRLHSYDWTQSDHYVTSISCPYIDDTRWATPDIPAFARAAQAQGLQVQVAIIGRDRNILSHQETRVRGRATFETAQDEYEKLTEWNPVYVSYELVHLYRHSYLQQLSKTLEFPIAYNHASIDEILQDDTNAKYIHPVDHHWTDRLMKTVKIT